MLLLGAAARLVKHRPVLLLGAVSRLEQTAVRHLQPPRYGWSGWRSGPCGGRSASQARRRAAAFVDAIGRVVTWWPRVDAIGEVLTSWRRGHSRDALQESTRVDQSDFIRRDAQRQDAARCAHQGSGRLVV